MITNFRSRLTRYGLVSVAVAALAVPAVVVGAASPASAAAPCGSSGPLLDRRAVDQTAGVAANMRSGSGTNCGVVGWADNQNFLIYFCWTLSSSGSRWTYLWNFSDGTRGWVSNSLLPGGGSTAPQYYCGF